ncbi:hypothetical protein PR048_019395 [Dryococelus australis]|uniref:Uncharacterized protein n=1 Tax=Dryococelus australis TaxID=614101 RepID=A0ABQ9H3F2_9NEOP|nr:hypothetical protein PR048_019395 [Dryococelus australis]
MKDKWFEQHHEADDCKCLNRSYDKTYNELKKRFPFDDHCWYPPCATHKGSGGAVAGAFAHHHGDPGSRPGGFTPGSSRVGIVLDDAACRWLSRGTLASPALAFQRRSIKGSHFMPGDDDGLLRIPAGKLVTWRVLRRLGFTPQPSRNQKWRTAGDSRFIPIPFVSRYLNCGATGSVGGARKSPSKVLLLGYPVASSKQPSPENHNKVRNKTPWINEHAVLVRSAGNKNIPEKTRRPASPSGTIPTCENPGENLPGIEPDFPKREASRLTAQLPRPLQFAWLLPHERLTFKEFDCSQSTRKLEPPVRLDGRSIVNHYTTTAPPARGTVILSPEWRLPGRRSDDPMLQVPEVACRVIRDAANGYRTHAPYLPACRSRTTGSEV